jgi:cytosine/adenosine deaminase-related metal-dependent hydrolase
MKTLIEDCAVLDAAAPWGYRAGQYIVIEENRIATVAGARPEGVFERILDGRRRLVIPGLINAHTHSPENYIRATDNRLPLEPWLVNLVWATGEFTERDHYLAAMLGVIEMLHSGTTGVLDHLTFAPVPNIEAVNGAMSAYRDSGIRAGVAPLFSNLSLDAADGQARGHGTADTVFAKLHDRQGEDDSGDSIFEFLGEVFARWHGAENGRLRCWAGPGGVQWVSLDWMHRCQDFVRPHNAGVHIHLMETRVQDHVSRQAFGGKTAVARLAEEGLLGPHLSLPHSVWLTDQDVRRIAEAGAVPVHNPAANLRLGSGLAPIRKMLDAGTAVGLGADGSKSSDHQNMFAHMHLAALIHNLTFAEPERWVSTRETVGMATEGGAAALMLRGELGKVAPGYLADLTLLDLDRPSLTPLNDAFHHLAYTELGGAVHTVIIDGKIVLEAGKILTFDEAAILAEVREATAHRIHRGPMPAPWQDAQDRYMAYQQDILRKTRFEQD